MKIFYRIIFVLFIPYWLTVTFGWAKERALPVYELDLELNLEDYTIEGRERVIFTNNTNSLIDQIYFYIYPHKRYTKEEREFILRYAGYFKVDPYPEGFQAADLEIISVNTDYSVEGEDRTILKVILSEPLKPQEKTEIEIKFKVIIPHTFGRLGRHKNIISLHRFYPILSVLDDEGWCNWPFYLYHQPYFSESSYYKVRLTLPQDQIVVHTGLLKEEITNDDRTKTLFFETDLPTRDFSLVISPDFKIYEKDFKEVRIKSYYLEGDDFYGKRGAEFASELMEFYTEEFGPYPYKEFSICPVYLGYGGHETSNIALIDTRVYKLPKFLIRYFDFLISHEAGHQWFFNIVGSNEYKETFLDEGINSYGVLKHLERKYGRNCEVMVLPKFARYFIPNFSFLSALRYRYLYMVKRGLDRKILGELSSFQEPSSIFAIAYSKGAGIIFNLESLLGEDLFRRSIKRYFKEFRFKNAKVKDFKRICEEESGLSLDDFFSDWLETKKICNYRIKKRKKNSVILERSGQIETPIRAKITAGGKRRELEHLWNGRGKTYEITTEEEISSVQIDLKAPLLETDRINNSSPPKLKIKLVPLYFFAYEIPVFLDEDRYNLILGPEISQGRMGLKTSFQKPYDYILYSSISYDFSDDQFKSYLGYTLRHLFGKRMDLGIEIFNFEREEVWGGKLFCRYELWPASYGLLDITDHITLYLLRNKKPRFHTTSMDRIENLYYRKKDEAIFGVTLKISSYGPYFDPQKGWKFNLTGENAGHFFGGKDYFFRLSPEFCYYLGIFSHQRLAFRLKSGLGIPDDKMLYQLGGSDGLRGYGRKQISGANMLLGSLEYRFLLIDNLKVSLFDNLILLESIGGVGFFDVGKSWYKNFRDSNFKKDVGFGLRFYLNIASFLEKVVLRLDFSEPINEPKKGLKSWFGLGHTF